MERTSPPTERVARLLDVLVAHPNERFTVSELACRADISKPTCIGIVRTLVQTGYLDRDPRNQTYALGPALIVAGRAAIEGLAPLTLVRDELTTVSERFDLACTAAAIRHDHLTIIERTGPPTIYDPMIQIGIRLPLVPPTGKLAVIFDSDERMEEWLRRESPTGKPLDRDRLRRLTEDAREAGYIVGQAGEPTDLLTALLNPIGGRGLSDEMVAVVSQVASSYGDDDYLQEQLRPGKKYPVSTVAAAAYDANAKIKLLLLLYVAGDAVPYSDIHRYGEAMLAAGETITRLIGGRNPWR